MLKNSAKTTLSSRDEVTESEVEGPIASLNDEILRFIQNANKEYFLSVNEFVVFLPIPEQFPSVKEKLLVLSSYRRPFLEKPKVMKPRFH